MRTAAPGSGARVLSSTPRDNAVCHIAGDQRPVHRLDIVDDGVEVAIGRDLGVNAHGVLQTPQVAARICLARMSRSTTGAPCIASRSESMVTSWTR
jgi:hypothetical protein